MRVLLVGDTHGNAAWFQRAVIPAALRHDADLIIQLGDFGWWPGAPSGDDFIETAQRSPIPVWWIDGNHENHDDLARVVNPAEAGAAVPLGGNLTYLPRGARFEIGDVGVVVCGGAHSIDRQLRSPGRSWFASERITDDDVARCAAGGTADILICHDAPAGWEIPGIIPDDLLPPKLQAELTSCASHRVQLARVLDAVEPTLVIHGHFHAAYALTVDQPWGSTEVVGLDCDGTEGNLTLLDCAAGEWTVTPLRSPT